MLFPEGEDRCVITLWRAAAKGDEFGLVSMGM